MIFIADLNHDLNQLNPDCSTSNTRSQLDGWLSVDR